MNKIKVVGIIAEYNPFHNGHLYQIKQIRKQFPNCCIIVIMSGDFVQRGSAAILNKWSRADVAISSGVDLVLELPFAYACRSAEYFAKGAVQILNATNIIDHIAFGAETSDIAKIFNISEYFLEPNNIVSIKSNMKEGLSYPKALQNSLPNKSWQDVISTPNNILAIEYVKQLLVLNSSIKPFLIKRNNSNHNDQSWTGTIASATSIRKSISTVGVNNSLSEVVPLATLTILQKAMSEKTIITDNERLSLLVLHKLMESTPSYLRQYTDVSEGLEYKIIKMAEQHNSFHDLVSSVVNKRYTYNRISRILIQTLIGLPQNTDPNYIKILSFNQNGQMLLKKIKAKSNLHIISKIGRDFANIPSSVNKCMLNTDIKASNIYQMLLPNNTRVHNIDFYRSPSFNKVNI